MSHRPCKIGAGAPTRGKRFAVWSAFSDDRSAPTQRKAARCSLLGMMGYNEFAVYVHNLCRDGLLVEVAPQSYVRIDPSTPAGRAR